MVRLPPQTRDNVLLVIEAICAGAARFDGSMIVGGLVIRPVELLAHVAASGSQDRFPPLTVERMTQALGQTVSARTYGEAALVMLTHWPRIEVRLQEDEAFARVVEDEQRVEAENARRQELINQRKQEKIKQHAKRAKQQAVVNKKAA